MTKSPGFVRACSDCARFVYGENGKVSTEPKLRGGRVVELPMLLKDYGMKPPCDVCPKWDGVPASVQRHPLPDDRDFGDWFWDLWESYYAGKACGFGTPDPLSRGAFAIFADVEAEADARQRESFGHSLYDAILNRTRR